MDYSDSNSEVDGMARRATTADRESLILLNPGLHRGGRGPARTFRALESGTVLVAEASGRVVGYLAFDYNFFDRGFVEYLVVHPDFRRRGLGAALMRAALELCESPDLFTSTNDSNKPMQSLLDSLGFVRCGSVDHLDPGDPEWFYVIHSE